MNLINRDLRPVNCTAVLRKSMLSGVLGLGGNPTTKLSLAPELPSLSLKSMRPRRGHAGTDLCPLGACILKDAQATCWLAYGQGGGRERVKFMYYNLVPCCGDVEVR